jgi:hypothetical protein
MSPFNDMLAACLSAELILKVAWTTMLDDKTSMDHTWAALVASHHKEKRV